MLTGQLATAVSERDNAMAEAARERSYVEQRVNDVRNVLEQQLTLLRAELEESRTGGRKQRTRTPGHQQSAGGEQTSDGVAPRTQI